MNTNSGKTSSHYTTYAIGVSTLTCNTAPQGTLFSAHQFGFERYKTAPWPSDTCWELVGKHRLLYTPTVLWSTVEIILYYFFIDEANITGG